MRREYNSPIAELSAALPLRCKGGLEMRARLLLGIALAFAPIALLAQGQVTALYTYPSDPEGAATCLAQADNGNLYGGGYVFNPAFPAVAPTVFAVNSCSWL